MLGEPQAQGSVELECGIHVGHHQIHLVEHRLRPHHQGFSFRATDR